MRDDVQEAADHGPEQAGGHYLGSGGLHRAGKLAPLPVVTRRLLAGGDDLAPGVLHHAGGADRGDVVEGERVVDDVVAARARVDAAVAVDDHAAAHGRRAGRLDHSLVRRVVEVRVVDHAPELDVPAEVDGAALDDVEPGVALRVAALAAAGRGGSAVRVAAGGPGLFVDDDARSGW